MNGGDAKRGMILLNLNLPRGDELNPMRIKNIKGYFPRRIKCNEIGHIYGMYVISLCLF